MTMIEKVFVMLKLETSNGAQKDFIKNFLKRCLTFLTNFHPYIADMFMKRTMKCFAMASSLINHIDTHEKGLCLRKNNISVLIQRCYFTFRMKTRTLM